SGDGGVIEAVLPRQTVLRRQDEQRTKVLAANVDQVLVLLAAEPPMSEEQLARALVAAREAGVRPLVALNKRDVQPAFDEAWQRLAPYRAMGETVLPLALTDPHDDGLAALWPELQGHATLVMGASGVGKSTLVNRLVPGAQAQTQAISKALGTGRHTTTHTTWYWLDEQRHSALIDSPGFHAFGLHHLDPRALAAWMPDLAPYIHQCRFADCTHRQEPGCAVRAALQPNGPLSPRRWQLYVMLLEELQAARARS
ncbi:MAG: ribosome small subunit-dependent GTPase A, partial [Tepidimonas sp.]|nr:ribosome small subunit-dependent GTPase A [Tepidimonas sp.]